MSPHDNTPLTAESGQPCPICGALRSRSERYPDALCNDCPERATDEAGRALAFSNVDFSGGFAARYRDTGEVRDTHLCVVDGVTCWADEARFGGIVLRPAPTGRRPRHGRRA